MTRRTHTHICGVHYTQGVSYKLERVYLPQVELKSHTTISPVAFTTRLTQTFQNSEHSALPQVRYTFPLYDGVAVNAYTISYGSKVLKGIVKQRDVAKKTYQAAVDRGETAGLLEALPAGVFGVTLGNIPAQTDIVVEITYCGELKHDAAIDGLRYNLPTSIAPRYGNYPGKVLDSNAVAKGGISITVDVDMAKSAIRKVQSPSHPIAVSMGAVSSSTGGNQAPFTPSQASATLTLRTTELADDFILQLLVDDINKPQAIVETHPTLPNQRAIMTTLVPKFTLEPIYPEIIFIADQSGSMGGAKNTALVSALKVFLKSLPQGIRFNICAFGSEFKFLWPKSQAYNEDNLNTAMSFVSSFTASYGGTEILKPITASFEQRLPDMPLEVMLLTDGEVWAEDSVFKYINEQIRDKKADARVFTLGIGSDVSHTLVEGVARAGNGFAQFVTQNEETDQKVIRMLKGALNAHTKDYALEVHYDKKENQEMTDDDDFEIVEKINDYLKIDDRAETSPQQPQTIAEKKTSFFEESADVDKPIQTESEKADRYAHLPTIETPRIVQAPNTIPPLFPFNRSTVYVLLGPESAQKNVTGITMRAKSAQGPLELNIPVQSSGTPAIAAIHQLAARKAMQDLEEGRGWIQAAQTADGVSVKAKYESRLDEIVERECVRLGERFQVAGKWTSFVAVEDKEDGETLAKDDVEQPVAAPEHGRGIQSFGAARSAPRGMMGGGGAMRHRRVVMEELDDDEDGSVEGITDPAESPIVSFCAAPMAAAPASAAPPPYAAAASKKFKRGNSNNPLADEDAADGAARPMTGFVTKISQAARETFSSQPVRKQMASMAAPRGRGGPPGGQGSSPEVQTMHELINLQTFSGAWVWNKEFFAALHISDSTVDLDELGGSRDVAATVLAVAYLETKVSAMKAVWDLVVAKARSYLISTLAVEGAQVDAMVVKAATYF